MSEQHSQLKQDMDELRRESGDALADITTAAKLLASELRDGYEDIKRRVLS
jgi:NTP pyrophosphatase (non-canonical NTP hydrolase)